MRITGQVEFRCANGESTLKDVDFDTDASAYLLENDLCDAVAFALYGKTVYQEIYVPETGVLVIAYLTIECKGKTLSVTRRPGHWRKTIMGNIYFMEDFFFIRDVGEVSCEKYYELMDEHLDRSFDEFVTIAKQNEN